MKNRKQILLGVTSYSKAVHLLFSSRLWLYLLVPVALNIVLWFVLSYIQDIMHQYIEAKLQSALHEYFVKFSWLETILSIASWLLNKLLFIVLYGYICGYLILLLLSPVLSMVSSKTEQIISGQQQTATWQEFLFDCLRGVLLAFRNSFLQSFWWFLATILSLSLFFIPVFGAIVVFCIQCTLFVITCYFYGFSFIDYAMERRRKSISQTIYFMRQHRGLAIGNGFVFAMALAVPFCGSILAGFVAIVSAIAATVAVLEIEKHDNAQ